MSQAENYHLGFGEISAKYCDLCGTLQRMRDAHKLEGNNKNHSRTGKYYLRGKTERAVTGYSKVKTAGCVLHNIPQIQQKNAMKRK